MISEKYALYWRKHIRAVDKMNYELRVILREQEKEMKRLKDEVMFLQSDLKWDNHFKVVMVEISGPKAE